jgi:hypothetical protein
MLKFFGKCNKIIVFLVSLYLGISMMSFSQKALSDLIDGLIVEPYEDEIKELNLNNIYYKTAQYYIIMPNPRMYIKTALKQGAKIEITDKNNFNSQADQQDKKQDNTNSQNLTNKQGDAIQKQEQKPAGNAAQTNNKSPYQGISVGDEESSISNQSGIGGGGFSGGGGIPFMKQGNKGDDSNGGGGGNNGGGGTTPEEICRSLTMTQVAKNLTILTNQIASDVSNVNLIYEKGMMLFCLGEYKKSGLELAKIYAINPNSALLNKADNDLVSNQFIKSLELYKKNPQSVDIGAHGQKLIEALELKNKNIENYVGDLNLDYQYNGSNTLDSEVEINKMYGSYKGSEDRLKNDLTEIYGNDTANDILKSRTDIVKYN